MKKMIEAVRIKEMRWKKAPRTFKVLKTTSIRFSSEKYVNSEELSKRWVVLQFLH